MLTTTKKLFEYLTPREKQVLLLVANGHSNKDIAKLLQLSNRTVEVHRAHIMEKIQVDNTTDLIVLAMECKLFENELLLNK